VRRARAITPGTPPGDDLLPIPTLGERGCTARLDGVGADHGHDPRSTFVMTPLYCAESSRDRPTLPDSLDPQS
jgi:hypothetical protein